MSLFDLQDVCIVIGSLATLDLQMVVDLIGIYVLKGPYCMLTTTNWFLQTLSVIPRGSWRYVARRFTMIRWASPKLRFRSHNGCGPTASCIPEPLRVTQMPPRRWGRATRHIPIEYEAQNVEVERSILVRRPRGQQFKKKPVSSSSGSGSSSNSSPRANFCGQCGGKHPSTQCVGVQSACNLCGQYGHFARVCPLSGSQHIAAPPQGRSGE
ncbi:hypothetical protein F511_07978 [Dorcoceras hygrometricum]|uniref:CCHC-type domain-containing protein n=1 Tax=Dorcoceras hygrometricum TaxID=472368 RepID=A0A2Z7BWS7_9LAMI|nr:hypothetical protein F511_07978 [Dorcoceras hygrometricum]